MSARLNGYKSFPQVSLRIPVKDSSQLSMNRLDVCRGKAQKDNTPFPRLKEDEAAEILVPGDKESSLFVRSLQQRTVRERCATDISRGYDVVAQLNQKPSRQRIDVLI